MGAKIAIVATACHLAESVHRVVWMVTKQEAYREIKAKKALSFTGSLRIAKMSVGRR